MKDIEIWRGDYVEINFTASQAGGDPLDLTVATKLWFLAKNSRADADVAAILTKTLAAGGIVLTGTNTGKVVILATDTSGLSDAQAPLEYDLQVLLPGTKPYTLESGRLFVKPDVTKATS